MTSSIHSMTAFSRHTGEHTWGNAVWEIRSVNHRYLEPIFKLPESSRQIEPQLREQLRKTLSRGKVECALKLQIQADQSSQIHVNPEVATSVIEAAQQIASQIANPALLNPLEILQWPGVMHESQQDGEQLLTDCLQSFTAALQQLIETRAREGVEMRQVIEQRLDSIDSISTQVKARLPEILAAQKQKLNDRLSELTGELNSDRVEQEIVLLAQKADVDEELDRLNTHTQEVRRVLKKGGPCGRRLDFLMQELNREANTLSSKSIVSDTTQAAVELKVLIEQMREQIQNIE